MVEEKLTHAEGGGGGGGGKLLWLSAPTFNTKSRTKAVANNQAGQAMI